MDLANPMFKVMMKIATEWPEVKLQLDDYIGERLRHLPEVKLQLDGGSRRSTPGFYTLHGSMEVIGSNRKQCFPSVIVATITDEGSDSRKQ